MTEVTPDFRCGYIALVGRPNVGKSTLNNALIGTKVSITSRKAQTTRHRIMGVLTREDAQFIFVDTPGFQVRHGGAMNKMMNRVVSQTLADVNVVLFLVQAGQWTTTDEALLAMLPKDAKVILVLSKTDLVKDKDSLYPFTAQVAARFDFAAVVPVSAVKSRQLNDLLDEVAKHLPLSEPHFDEDTLTDRPMRFLVAELVREKIFRLVGDELPYGCTVVIEQWEETDTHATINACVIVQRESHRPILLGAKGVHMKRIATEARQDIAKLLDKPVHLEVYIKVKKGWTDRQSSLQEFGYE
jgi:GTP-binding protein Era